ncbi:MAG: FG-GAP repeat protein [Chthoniobacterales bacterium]
MKPRSRERSKARSQQAYVKASNAGGGYFFGQAVAISGNTVVIGAFGEASRGVVGTDPQTVVVRAIGPSFPLAGSLADPTLELHNSDGTLLTANDNWRDVQESEISATGLQPAADAESAVLATLPPAAYTAIVRGVNDSPASAWWKFTG